MTKFYKGDLVRTNTAEIGVVENFGYVYSPIIINGEIERIRNSNLFLIKRGQYGLSQIAKEMELKIKINQSLTKAQLIELLSCVDDDAKILVANYTKVMPISIEFTVKDDALFLTCF